MGFSKDLGGVEEGAPIKNPTIKCRMYMGVLGLGLVGGWGWGEGMSAPLHRKVDLE